MSNDKNIYKLNELEKEYALSQFQQKYGVNFHGEPLKEAVAAEIIESFLNSDKIEEQQEALDLLPNTINNLIYPEKMVADTMEVVRKLPNIPIQTTAPDLTLGTRFYADKSDIGIDMFIDENTLKNERYTVTSDITPFDILVYNTICSLIISGIGDNVNDIEESKRFFTPKMVYNCFNPSSAKTTHINEESQQVEEVRKSIDKMLSVRIKLDYTSFINQNKKIDKNEKEQRRNDYAAVEDNFISASKTTVTVNGQTSYGYRLNAVPILFWQNLKLARQIATYDRKLLDTPKLRDKSPNNDLSVMKAQILEHIQTLKHNPKMSKKLSYETFFQRCGIDISDRTVKKRKRDQLAKYLTFLKDAGEIKGFSEYKHGNKFIGITFKL